MPKGIIGAMLILLVFAAAIGTVAPAASGADILKASGNPLVEALVAPHAYNGETIVSRFVNIVGLLGLIASFFSIIYAYLRQTFALSRAGYLPKILARTGRRKTPVLALIIPGVIGFILAIFNNGSLLILVAVFGATTSYILMTASHIILRVKEPDLHRPYRTPAEWSRLGSRSCSPVSPWSRASLSTPGWSSSLRSSMRSPSRTSAYTAAATSWRPTRRRSSRSSWRPSPS